MDSLRSRQPIHMPLIPIVIVYILGRKMWVPCVKGPGSRERGLEAVRRRLAAAHPLREGLPMEDPGLFVVDTCAQFLRTVPVLPRSSTKPDDVDTEAEDHILDETRYQVATRKLQAGRLRRVTT